MSGSIRNLMVRAGADFSPLQREMARTQTSMQQFGRTTEHTMSTVTNAFRGMSISAVTELGALAGSMGAGGVVAVALAGVGLIGKAWYELEKPAIAMESATARVNFALGENAQQFHDWAYVQGGALGYSEQAANEYGAQFLSMVRNFSTGTEDMRNKTEDLMTTIAQLSSHTGRPVEDVAERVASGLRGETDAIEDLGVFVSEAAINQSNAFKTMGQGAKTFGSVADENLKSQIRYYAILEQAQKQTGGTMLSSTSTSLNALKVEWQNFTLYMSQILQEPFNDFIKGVTKVVHYMSVVAKMMSSFFNGLFGHKEPPMAKSKDIDKMMKQTNAINNQTKAVKKLKSAKVDASRGVAGFDQVNTLSAVNGASNDGGLGSDGNLGAGLKDLDSALNTVIPKQSNFNSKVLECAKNFGLMGKGLNDILKGNFKTGLDEIAKGFSGVWGQLFGHKKGEQMYDGLTKVNKGLADIMKGKFKKGLEEISAGFKSISKAVFGTKTTNLFVGIGKVLSGVKDIVRGDYGKGLLKIASGFKSIYNAIGGKTMNGFLKSTWNWIADKLNWLIGKIDTFIGKLKGISVFGKHPFGGLSKIGVSIPKLAKGGITNGPMLAMIGDNRGGREVVSPLDKLTGLVSSAVVQAMAMSNMNNGGGGGDIVLNIDGRTFARAIKPYQNLEQNRVGSNVRLNSI
jgi:hypothetical protein